jgi:hypothetical protein
MNPPARAGHPAHLLEDVLPKTKPSASATPPALTAMRSWTMILAAASAHCGLATCYSLSRRPVAHNRIPCPKYHLRSAFLSS